MKNKYVYTVYERYYEDRLGQQVEDEMNLWESDSVKNLIDLLRSKNIKVAKSIIYKSIKEHRPIYDKYFVYKIKL